MFRGNHLIPLGVYRKDRDLHLDRGKTGLRLGLGLGSGSGLGLGLGLGLDMVRDTTGYASWQHTSRS